MRNITGCTGITPTGQSPCNFMKRHHDPPKINHSHHSPTVRHIDSTNLVDLSMGKNPTNTISESKAVLQKLYKYLNLGQVQSIVDGNHWNDLTMGSQWGNQMVSHGNPPVGQVSKVNQSLSITFPNRKPIKTNPKK